MLLRPPDGWAGCVRCQCENQWTETMTTSHSYEWATNPDESKWKDEPDDSWYFRSFFFHFICYSSLVLLQQASVVYSRIIIYFLPFSTQHGRVSIEKFVRMLISFCCVRCASSRQSYEKLALVVRNFSSLPKWHTHCSLKWWTQSSKQAGRIICNCKTNTHTRISFIRNLNLIQSKIYIYLYLC